MRKRLTGLILAFVLVISLGGCSLLSSSLTMPDSLREAIVTNVEYVKAESVALKAEIAAVKAEVQAKPEAAELRRAADEARVQADKAGQSAYDARTAATDAAASALQQAASGVATTVTGVATGDLMQIVQGLSNLVTPILILLGLRKVGTLTTATVDAEARKTERDDKMAVALKLPGAGGAAATGL